MATCSSILAWETPWTEEPDGLQSMGVNASRERGSRVLRVRVRFGWRDMCVCMCICVCVWFVYVSVCLCTFVYQRSQ